MWTILPFFFFFKRFSIFWLYRAFVASGGLSLVVVCGLLIAVTSLAVDLRLQELYFLGSGTPVQ